MEVLEKKLQNFNFCRVAQSGSAIVCLANCEMLPHFLSKGHYISQLLLGVRYDFRLIRISLFRAEALFFFVVSTFFSRLAEKFCSLRFFKIYFGGRHRMSFIS